jgi:hypothetical protein
VILDPNLDRVHVILYEKEATAVKLKRKILKKKK